MRDHAYAGIVMDDVLVRTPFRSEAGAGYFQEMPRQNVVRAPLFIYACVKSSGSAIVTGAALRLGCTTALRRLVDKTSPFREE
jgi:hypothetical protein